MNDDAAITRRILESGLIDRHTEIMLSRWGIDTTHREEVNNDLRKLVLDLAVLMDRELMGIPDEVSLD
tara:strand:+ start:135 stop:338 length:204 start_codon:yes stop_codon:yes gene_type:complete